MSEEKIINGIDVSESVLTATNNDVYYSQKAVDELQNVIKRLQEENKELKRRCEEWAWDSVKLQAQIDSKDYQLNRYKEILKDIRDI